MPLPKRLVEPVYVARGTIPEDFPLPSELEAATNGTLANAVRQLSSLSKHAEDLFGELARDAHVLATRANNLQARIDRLAIKVTQLDSNVEEVSLQDIHMRKAFKSSVVFDQKVVSRDTMPTAMLETYKLCDKPPPLDKLNPYSRQLDTTSLVFSSTPQDALTCTEKSGLILGVHSSAEDSSGSHFKLTRTAEKFDKECGGRLSTLLEIAKPVPKLGKAKVFYGLHHEYVGVAVVGLGDDCVGYNPHECLDERKEAVRTAVGVGVKALYDVEVPKLYVESFDDAESAAEGASLASWLYQELKDSRKRKYIKKLELFDSCDLTGWKIGLHKGAAQNLARLLQETPGSNLTPCIFAQTAIEMLARYGISVNVRMKSWAKLRNLNCFVAVSRASCEPPVFLEILYEGCDPTICPIVVIGKGVTFNSGGLCLRQCKNMKHAHGDLIGAAAIVAMFRAIAALNLPLNVLGLVPLCSNLIGANAFKPGDIYRTYNGKTVLVENTECEGLLLHADTLSFAQEYNPRLILDIGTFGTDVVGALGSSASSVFCNNDSLYEMMHVASIHTGDRIFRFPLWNYFTDYMKSKTADYTNKVPKDIGGGHCKTAAFLREFVPPGIDWIHVEAYNVYITNGIDYSYLRKGMSGRPTRTIIEFLAQLSCRDFE